VKLYITSVAKINSIILPYCRNCSAEYVNGDKTRNELQSLISTEDSSVKGDDDDEYLLTK